MDTLVTELDKSLTSELPDDYGVIAIRVVVVKRLTDADGNSDVPEIPLDASDDEVLPTSGKTPVSTYLEDSKRGKECCVFLINGQRQEAWDNAFIVRDLDKKYLRTRMLIIVDLDGLRPEAMGELMSGDRQGFFQGKAYDAISARLAAALRKDPDLERLEEDAEREISELKTGDEAVKQALDQLIDEHHAAAERVSSGLEQSGEGKGQKSFGKDINTVTVVAPQEIGTATTGPYLIGTPGGAALRLHPDERTTLKVETSPATAWADVGQLHVEIKPAVENLTVKTARDDARATVTMDFEEPDDWGDDSYPVETSIRITAMIKGHAEPRVLERQIVISKPKKRKPRKPPVLLEVPTFIKVTSRQPVAIVAGGADVHVRLRWDGMDSLAAGSSPQWTFSATCTNNATVPSIAFTRPRNGGFEALIQPPKGLESGTQLTFDVTATGPSGATLKAVFVGEVVGPPLPRKVKQMVPEPASQRRPPYDLNYVNESKWDSGTCWGQRNWTGADCGCFIEPSQTKALTLIINEDMELLRQYRDSLTSRKLEPATVKERVTRYTSHIAFHLYQMYQHFRDTEKAFKADDSNIKPPTTEDMAGEVNRVAATLIKVMEVSR
jgi:hypothetical protein